MGEKFNDALSVLIEAEAAGEVDGVKISYQDVLENMITLVYVSLSNFMCADPTQVSWA